jgi:hypothetical protein
MCFRQRFDTLSRVRSHQLHYFQIEPQMSMQELQRLSTLISCMLLYELSDPKTRATTTSPVTTDKHLAKGQQVLSGHPGILSRALAPHRPITPLLSRCTLSKNQPEATSNAQQYQGSSNTSGQTAALRIKQYLPPTAHILI